MYSGVTAWTFILRLLRDPQGQHTFLLFTDLVNEDMENSRARLTNFPGLLSVDEALKETSDKREALQTMEDKHLDWIPVVDEGFRFKGVVERSRLVASMILDITNRLERSKQGMSNKGRER
jgi:CBS domain-containing protein